MCVTHIANRHFGWRMQPVEGSPPNATQIHLLLQYVCAICIPTTLKINTRAYDISGLQLMIIFI